MGWAAGRLSSRAIRLELGPGSGAHTWHLRLWSKATRSQCTEGLGGEKGAERVAKGFECCESAEVAEGGSVVPYQCGGDQVIKCTGTAISFGEGHHTWGTHRGHNYGDYLCTQL